MSPVILSARPTVSPSIYTFNTTKPITTRDDSKCFAQFPPSCNNQVLPIPAPNQGAIIALGVICGLLIIGVAGLCFLIIKLSHHYQEEQDELKKGIKAHQRMIPGPRLTKRYLASQHHRVEKPSPSTSKRAAPPHYQDPRRVKLVPDQRPSHIVFPSNLGNFNSTNEKVGSHEKMFFPYPGPPLNAPRYPPRTQTDHPLSAIPPAYLRPERTKHAYSDQGIEKDEDEVSEIESSDGISSMQGEISEVSPCSTVIERRESKRSRCSKGSLRCKRR